MNEQNQKSSYSGKQSGEQETDDYNSFSLTLQTLSRASIATLEKKKIEIAVANKSFFEGLKKLSLEDVSRAVEKAETEDLLPLLYFLNSVRDSLSVKAKERLDRINNFLGQKTEEKF